MPAYLEAVLLAIAVGAGGTEIGALGALSVRRPRKVLSCVLLGLAGGIIIALAVLDMLPESYDMNGPIPFWAGLILGIIVLAFITSKSHQNHAHDASEQEAHEIARRSLMKTGVLLAAGMAVHNLPQGIAIGSGIEADYIAATAILLFLHNIPEGMAMALPLKIGGVSGKRILLIALLTAIPTVFGAVLGVLAGEVSSGFVAGCMSFAAGAMLYLAASELIPQSAALGRPVWVMIAVAAGFAAGWGLIAIIE